jgi:hypothetical protein
MTPSESIPRRFFLQVLFSLHIYALIGQYARKDTSNSVDPLPSKLGSFFSHKESATKVGLEYLKSTPMEADIYLLSNLICSSNEEHRAKLLHADSRKLRELLRQRLCLDFEQDRIVNVQGWILAVTEARLCALAALL